VNLLQRPCDDPGDIALTEFLDRYRATLLSKRCILELGTRQWDNGSSHHKSLLAPFSKYVMADVMAGEDVDVVCDAHTLSKTFDSNQFSVVWASSVWEHLKRPWIAAEEVLKVLRPGGLFYIQTHQSFPVHGYPNDYFRFTDRALASLFESAEDVVTSYQFPATITPHAKDIEWNSEAPVWLNVCITGRKGHAA
jgi:SAM-dependent methyltransferase